MATRVRQRRIPVLGSLARVGRLTWVEILKLVSHKLFPAIVVITLVVTTGLGLAGKHFTGDDVSRVQFSSYSLWVVSSSFGLRIGIVLLVALGAMAMSTEATARTLNTVLSRPIRRVEFALAKALSLAFATVAVVAAAALAAYIIGGTVKESPAVRAWRHSGPARADAGFPSYGDVVDPDYPEAVIATKAEVMRDILFGYLLLVVPILAAVSLGFLLGTLVDSTGLAIGLSVGLFVTLEATKFIPLFEEHLGRYAYNYPVNRISTLMLEASKGSPPVWDDALAGVGVSAIYVGICLLVSLFVFCRRDITL